MKWRGGLVAVSRGERAPHLYSELPYEGLRKGSIRFYEGRIL